MTEAPTYADWLARKHTMKFDVRPFIGGRLVESHSSALIDKTDPANGSILYSFAEGSEQDVNDAVAAARGAFESGIWQHRPIAERKAVIHKLADLVERDAQEIALMESVEVGKPIRDASTIDIALAALILRHAADAADHVLGNTYPTDGGSLAFSIKAPRGVVGAIIGWNFPLVLATQKIGPALVTGNSLVLKPSELSSLSALKMAELAKEAGLPDGVFNVVPGIGATIGHALSHHMDVDMISFTGSTVTGKRLIAAAAASNMKRLLLECGGKSPNIVFADAPDLEQVAAHVFQRMFWNQGQVCSAGTRLIVHKDVKDRLLELVSRNTGLLIKGDPLNPENTFGPLISGPQRDKVMDYITIGSDQGAQLHIGGSSTLHETGGFYVEPTIFTGVDATMRIAQEEIFGPVLSVLEFDSVDEAIRLANSTTYGLSAIAWTTSLDTARRLARDIKVAGLSIMGTTNPTPGAPFGSMPVEPHNQSGIGVEGGLEGLSSYTITKSVQIFS